MSIIGSILKVEKQDSGYSRIASRVYDRVVPHFSINFGKYLSRRFLPDEFTAGKVLDVGCGGGQLCEWMAVNYGELEISGLDYSTEQIKLANDRFASAGYEADFIHGSALEMPIEDNSFDYVFSVGSIKHWPDRIVGLKECFRVLKPGGTLALCELDPKFNDEKVANLLGIPSIASTLLKPGKYGYERALDFSLSLQELIEVASHLDSPKIQVERVDTLPILLISGSK